MDFLLSAQERCLIEASQVRWQALSRPGPFRGFRRGRRRRKDGPLPRCCHPLELVVRHIVQRQRLDPLITESGQEPADAHHVQAIPPGECFRGCPPGVALEQLRLNGFVSAPRDSYLVQRISSVVTLCDWSVAHDSSLNRPFSGPLRLLRTNTAHAGRTDHIHSVVDTSDAVEIP